MADFNVQVKVRNGRFLRAMRAKGYYTAADLARASGVSNTDIGKFLNLKQGPYMKNGDLRPVAMAVCEVLDAMPSDLWPRRILDAQMDSNVAEAELTAAQVAQLVAPQGNPEHRLLIGKLCGRLTPKEADVVGRRNAGETLEEVAQDYGVGRERIRQIEARGLRKMRAKAKALGIEALEEFPA